MAGWTVRPKLSCVLCAAVALACSDATPERAQGSAGAASSAAGAVSAGGTGGDATGGPSAGKGGGSGSGGTAGTGAGRGGSGIGTGGGRGIGVAGDGGGAGKGTAGSGAMAGAPEPGSRAAQRAMLGDQIAELADLDAQSIVSRYPTDFKAAPDYDPSTILGLDALAASALALTDSQAAALAKDGFVIAADRSFPTFAYGYSTIYSEDLPVFISADAILDAVHRSYDRLLEAIETARLVSELTLLLDGMRAGLAAGTGSELGADARADADTYLAVAASLLEGQTLAPVAGGSDTDIRSLYDHVNAGGQASVSLFGETRENEDFSQFTPRGHYTNSEVLGRYFRAMMWLGRIDLRLLETQSDGTRVFRRRQLDAMLLMNALVSAELRAHFTAVDQVVRVFVGEPDYMVLEQVASLEHDVGITTLADAPAVSDAILEQAIIDGGYGAQRIASHIMENGLATPGTLPLTLSFALLGQRYVVDSHVFSNLVYDRVGGGKIQRLMPNPLDVAFAALGNNQAAALLAPDLETYPYAPDLAAMRLLADAHPPDFWQGSIYNLWLGALRELSPNAIAASSGASALGKTFQTEPWGRRLLQTELASWAQLRRDTILYSKQSYASGAQCEFPDGYVDPYPELYAKLGAYAALGKATVGPLVAGTQYETRVTAYFDNLSTVATRLHDMAEHQRTGAAYTQDMIDFLNDAVWVGSGCGEPYLGSGWYADLFFDPSLAAIWSPTIADVHTQPFDAAGNPVGNVLHVGTGDARLMIVVADTCSGPHAYAGVVSSYQEHVTTNFERLDDATWKNMVRAEPDVPWVRDVLTP